MGDQSGWWADQLLEDTPIEPGHIRNAPAHKPDCLWSTDGFVSPREGLTPCICQSSTVEHGPWFPHQLGKTWTVMRRDWQHAQRPPIAFLDGKEEAIAVAQALNDVWQLKASMPDVDGATETTSGGGHGGAHSTSD